MHRCAVRDDEVGGAGAAPAGGCEVAHFGVRVVWVGEWRFGRFLMSGMVGRCGMGRIWDGVRWVFWVGW